MDRVDVLGMRDEVVPGGSGFVIRDGWTGGWVLRIGALSISWINVQIT